jgi:hypothetical protein
VVLSWLFSLRSQTYRLNPAAFYFFLLANFLRKASDSQLFMKFCWHLFRARTPPNFAACILIIRGLWLSRQSKKMLPCLVIHMVCPVRAIGLSCNQSRKSFPAFRIRYIRRRFRFPLQGRGPAEWGHRSRSHIRFS